MKKILLLHILSLFLSTIASAYEENVHEKITEKAISSSYCGPYLSGNLNISLETKFDGRPAIEWLKLGSNWEDASPRWINHFYDPTTGEGSIGLPSLQWGKGSLLNLYSWSWAREYYRLALISSDPHDRGKNFADLFRSLGQVMHLLHDLAVPAHVRNDLHPYMLESISDDIFQERDMYEKYTKLNVDSPALKYSGYPAVDINTFNSFDTFWVNGGRGLAEYTNQNFLSRDTIFKSYASPQKAASSWVLSPEIESDGKADYRIYLKGETTEGEAITHFVSTGYLWSELSEVDPVGMDDSRFNLDDNCHKDYASLLIPRAVGYSAGLLNYFFRGQMDTNGHETTDSNGNINGISVKVRNITTNEDMNNGKLVVSYRYKAFGETDYTYGISSEVNSGTLTANAVSYTTYAFTFANPIPSNATEVQYILVFHDGYLGNEQNAVAAKMIDTEAFKIKLTRDGDVLLTPTSLADTSLPGPKNRAGAYIYIGLYDSSNNWVTGGTATFSNGQQTYNGITFDETTGYWKLNLPLGYKEPSGNKGFWMEYWSTIGTTYSRYPRVYQWSKFEDEKNLIHPGIYEDIIPLWWIEGPDYYPSIGYPSKVALKVHSSVPYLVQYSFAQQVAEYLVPETDPIQYLYYRVGETVTINGSKEINLPCMLYDQNTGSNEILDIESNGPSIDGKNFEESWELTDYCSTETAWYTKPIIREAGGISAGFEF